LDRDPATRLAAKGTEQQKARARRADVDGGDHLPLGLLGADARHVQADREHVLAGEPAVLGVGAVAHAGIREVVATWLRLGRDAVALAPAGCGT
jgi:hypothetical protein